MQRILQVIGIFAVASRSTFGQPDSETQSVIIATPNDFRQYDNGPYRRIDSLASTLNYLQNSGASIKHLIFHGESYSAADQAEISRNIVRYCSETLPRLELHEAGDELLSVTSQPDENQFKKLVRLELRYNNLPENLEINQIYPSLEHLQFTTIDGNDDVEPSQEANLSYLERISAVLPSIPNLRALSIIAPSNSIYSVIQANLPSLEALEITYDPSQPIREPVHFTNLRNLSVHILPVMKSTASDREWPFETVMEPLPFTADRLESISVKSIDISEMITTWIAQNAGLKKCALKFSFDHESLQRVGRTLDSLPKMEQVILCGSGGLTLAELVPYFTNVDKVTFTPVGMFGDTYDSLSREGMPDDWEVVDDWDDVEMRPSVTAIRRTNAVTEEAAGDCGEL